MLFRRMNLHQEKELVQKAKQDPAVFSGLYDAHYSKIFNYVLRRVADLELSQDITSEVFLKAFSKLWLFRWRKISFSCWLYKIALHEISNHFRKNKRPTISLDDLLENKNFEPTNFETPKSELIEAQNILEKHEDFLKIQKMLLKLPLKYQEVLSLKFFEHKTTKEIGEILGKKEGTVKSLLSRGIDQLRALVT